MQEKKITRMVEQLIRTEYVAEDGTVFSDEKECKKYEQSALFIVSSMLKRLYVGNEWSFFGHGYDDTNLEVFDIQTETDLENLKRYLYLVMTQHGQNDRGAQSNISKYEFTAGHEVIISWDYDEFSFCTIGDGSIDAYAAHCRKLITPKNEEE